MKKRIAALLAAAALICGVSSCADGKPAQTSEAPAAETEAPAKKFTAKEVTDAVLDEVSIASAFDKSRETLGDYFYDLDVDAVEDFSFVLCASGMSPDEIAVFKMKSEDAAASALAAVEKRLKEQTDTYTTYTPDEVYKLEGAVIKQKGVYVYYIVSSDNSKAEEIVKDFIG